MSSVLREIEAELFHYLLYPATVPIIAAKAGDEAGAMPAVWTTSLSMSPPLLMTAIAPERRTYRLVRESGYFTVNLLDFSKADALAFVGDVSGRVVRDKLERAGLTLVPARRIPSVAVGEAVAVMECELKQVVDVGGDHDIFVGRVVAAYASEDFTEGGWRLEKYKPILYVGRSRRPGPVKRRFATVGPLVEFEYARGMTDAVEKRRHMQRAAEEAVAELAERLGLDVDDAAYLLLDTLKNLLGKKWKG